MLNFSKLSVHKRWLDKHVTHARSTDSSATADRPSSSSIIALVVGITFAVLILSCPFQSILVKP